MTAPCSCGKFKDGPYTLDQCRVCWLNAHDQEYRDLWAGQAPPPPSPPPPVKRPPCPMLGRRARDAEGKIKTRWCNTG
jgi:hypothetical protein